jgi:hypothetical protein
MKLTVVMPLYNEEETLKENWTGWEISISTKR